MGIHGVFFVISILKRRVRVLADTGLKEKVEPDIWQEVVDIIIGGYKEKKLMRVYYIVNKG